MSQEYPHCILVQFKTTKKEMFGTTAELEWRHETEERLGEVLEDAGLGYCDGGQIGSGSMEMFFYTDDTNKAAQLLIDTLTDDEYIGYCKIALLNKSAKEWIVLYPPNVKDIYFFGEG